MISAPSSSSCCVGDRLDRAARADRHERRRLDDAVRRVQLAAPRRAVAVGDAEGECRHGFRILRGSHSKSRLLFSTLAGPHRRARSRSATSRLARAQGCYPVSVKRLRVGVLYGGRSGEHEVSLASAAAVFAHLDKKRYEPVPIRIDKDGRWALADRRADRDVGERSDRTGATRCRAAAAERPRSALHRAAERGDDPLDRSRRGARRRARPRDRHRPQPRRDLPGAARALRRGRHDPGAARARQRALRRRRRAGVGGRHGQGDDEGRLRRARPAGRARIASSCATSGTAAARTSCRELEAALGFPMFVKPANLGSSVGISKAKDPDGAWRGDRPRRRPSIARSSSKRRCPRRARSSARCSATTSPRRRCRARSSRRASSTTTRRSTSTTRSQTVIPADLPGRERREIRRLSIAAFRAIDCAGMARVDFLLSRPTGQHLRQRGEHDSRVHDDQHVLEAVGRVRRRVPRAARSADRARARASRRQAAAPHQPHMRRGGRRWRCARCCGRARRAAPRAGTPPTDAAGSAARTRRQLRGEDALVRAYDFILDARFDQVDAELRRACGPDARRRRRTDRVRRPPKPATSSRRRRSGGASSSTPRTATLDAAFTASVERAIRDDRGVDRTQPARRRSLVLPRRRLRRAGAVAGAAEREARRGARRQADQGGARAGARARPGPRRRVLRARDVQVLRRRRADGREDPAVPAAAARRRPRGRPARDAARPRPAAGCSRARPTTSCTSSISGTSGSRRARSSCCGGSSERYPGNPLFPAQIAHIQDAYQHDLIASLDTWRALLAAAREQRVNDAGARRGAGAARHRATARGAAPDRSRDRAAAGGRRAEAATRRTRRSRWRTCGSAKRTIGSGARAAAIAAYRSAVAAAPRDDPLDVRGAAPSACSAARRTPKKAEAYRLSLAGWRRLEQKDLASASASLERSLALDPDDPGRALSLRPRAAGAERGRRRARAVRARRSRNARTCPPPILRQRPPRSGAPARARRPSRRGDRRLSHRRDALRRRSGDARGRAARARTPRQVVFTLDVAATSPIQRAIDHARRETRASRQNYASVF